MNIFVLDKNPFKAAEYHYDKHVVKMILETAQILETVRSLWDIPCTLKPTRMHHPCVKWAQHPVHFAWLSHLGLGLLDEYEKRYNRVHKYASLIEDNSCLMGTVDRFYPKNWVYCMPDKYKIDGYIVESYRNYYMSKSFAKWIN